MAEIDSISLKKAADYFLRIIGAEDIVYVSDGDESAYKYVILTAEEFGVTPMKMRKMLITAGVYSTETSRLVAELHDAGKSVEEIQRATGLKRSAINGYLPYSKGMYNQTEKSAGADRVELCRRRQRAIKRLQKNPSEETLWDCIVEHQNYQFRTMSGLPYKYQLKIGKDGQYTRELIVDRREASKTLAWSSVRLAYNNALAYEGVVPRPKALGDIRGISYIYPLLGHFGVIEVAE